MFSTDIYAARRDVLTAQIDSGLLLFLGNEDSPMNFTDNIYPFRQDSSFLYYFGLDQPGLAATVDLDDGTTTLYGDDLTIDQIVWMGNQPTIAERAALAGVSNAARAADLAEVASRASSAGRTAHFLPPYRAENMLKLSNLLGIAPARAHEAASEPFTRAVIAQRSLKAPEEIEEIERAVTVTCAMHVKAMEMARPGMVEQEIAAAVQEVTEGAGGRLSFPAIVTVHGETLHNHYHGNILESGQMLLNDSGAESPLHYAGDMSRTFPVDPTFTPKQKEIYQIALDAHEAAIAALAPGVPYRDVHLLACRTIAAGLKDLGLIKGDVDEAVAAGAHALFFQCGTGHMMGLDVHDMEDLGEDWVGYGEGFERSPQFGLKSLRLAKELQPGFVLTVEPGIYFIPELTDMWRADGKHADFIDYDKVEAYSDFGGLRSEEDFVITEDGARLLGPPVAKTIDEVEAVRAK
ncbi:MAG: aminopeptidase P family protein [Thermoanaerobaculia bacterium]